MDLNVDYSKVSNEQEAYEKVKGQITPELIERFKVKADVKYDDKAKLVTAKGKGFEVIITFNSSSAQVELNLSLLYRPLKSQIKSGLEKQLKRVI